MSYIINVYLRSVDPQRIGAALESAEREGYSAGWKDKQGYWTSTDDNYFVVGYNTRLVSERDAPRDWEDLLLPKWRGQIGLDPDNHLLFGGLEQIWGREKALAYFRKLAQQQVQFRKGNTLIAQLIVAENTRQVLFTRTEWNFQIAKSSYGLGIDDESNHHHRRSARFSGQGSASQRRKAFDRFRSFEERPSAIEKLLPHSVTGGLEPLSAKLDPRRLHLLPMLPNAAEKEDDWRRQFRSISASRLGPRQ